MPSKLFLMFFNTIFSLFISVRNELGELATMSLEFESPSNSPVAPHLLSCQISAN